MPNSSPEQFDDLVDRAIEALPSWVREHMQNVVVITADWPSRQQLRGAGVAQNSLLLGLYEGVPLSRRGSGYHLAPPDRITLFRRSLEMVARDEAHLVDLIQRTIIHEIAHHFGFDEEELDRIEGPDD